MHLQADTQKPKLSELNEAPFPMFKIAKDPRYVGIGRLLSRAGLDELPQLLNIIKGEMSFVGPRPLPLSEANQLSTAWNFRYRVRPGILSEWAVSEKRHTSLAHWRTLEEVTLKRGGILYDIGLLVRTVVALV